MNERFKTQGFVLQSFPNDISEVEYMFQEAWYPDLILYLKTDLKLIARQRLPNRLEEWKNRRDKKKVNRIKKERISLERAKSLLRVGYKTLSYLHCWCSVQVFVGNPVIPFQNIIHVKSKQTSKTYSVVLGKHIFFSIKLRGN
ncbi:uncharacterized protein LOC143258449 [Tachypleus tridentatus]|uniref:uncharacterized protein LOC143258449 n=1 Tax=Tachypleus tridentatus TaxID=6853 RepID=UPI003FD26B19